MEKVNRRFEKNDRNHNAQKYGLGERRSTLAQSAKGYDLQTSTPQQFLQGRVKKKAVGTVKTTHTHIFIRVYVRARFILVYMTYLNLNGTKTKSSIYTIIT